MLSAIFNFNAIFLKRNHLLDMLKKTIVGEDMKQNHFTKYLFLFGLVLIFENCSLTAHSEKYLLTPPKEEISESFWLEIFPHLLPEELEIKQQLDDLFGTGSVILNPKTLKAAGFTKNTKRDFSLLVVTKHPNFPGYVFKIYLDDETKKPDEKAQSFFLRRINGALAIQEYIDVNDLGMFFKVPRKWIYPLPVNAVGRNINSKKYAYKNFILVEEDMDILDEKANIKAWRSSLVTKDFLRGLDGILNDVGLIDCTKLDNIPFCIDGKVAFIDTESFGHRNIPCKRLTNFLPDHLRSFWKKLIM